MLEKASPVLLLESTQPLKITSVLFSHLVEIEEILGIVLVLRNILTYYFDIYEGFSYFQS